MIRIVFELDEETYNFLKFISNSETGVSVEELGEEFDLATSTIGNRLLKLRGLGLVRRIRDNGSLLAVVTRKGEKALQDFEQKEQNPINEGVIGVAKLSFEVDDDVASEIKELAEKEELSVSSFLEELVVDALDEFYPVEGDEEIEEGLEETR